MRNDKRNRYRMEYDPLLLRTLNFPSFFLFPFFSREKFGREREKEKREKEGSENNTLVSLIFSLKIPSFFPTKEGLKKFLDFK